eukprot:RCo017999
MESESSHRPGKKAGWEGEAGCISVWFCTNVNVFFSVAWFLSSPSSPSSFPRPRVCARFSSSSVGVAVTEEACLACFPSDCGPSEKPPPCGYRGQLRVLPFSMLGVMLVYTRDLALHFQLIRGTRESVTQIR